MSEQIKIAFGYKMGSGKDTAVDYLIEKYTGERVKFADPIYDIMHYAQKVCGFPIEKDRKFLQWVGTDWARAKDNDVWVKSAIREASQTKNLFCSDMRFVNEYEALGNCNFIRVKLTRDVSDERIGTGYKLHTSENELDSIRDEEWDYVINNDGTIEIFFEKLNMIVKENYVLDKR